MKLFNEPIMITTSLFKRPEMSMIDKMEENIQYKFPEDYRKFLETYNGGFVSPDKIEINHQQGRTTVDILYGIMDSSSGYDHLDLEKNFNSKKHQIPAGVLPIGHDPGGNYICIALTEDKHGQVYFYDHEEPNEESHGNVNWNNLYLVAKSFSDFLSKLH
jgi:cell wall assembly regulator SMI1